MSHPLGSVTNVSSKVTDALPFCSIMRVSIRGTEVPFPLLHHEGIPKGDRDPFPFAHHEGVLYGTTVSSPLLHHEGVIEGDCDPFASAPL